MRRVLIYAVVYGAVGALIGTCVALYTRDIEVPHKTIVSKNGSAIKAGKTHSSSPDTVKIEVAEPTTSTMEETN